MNHNYSQSGREADPCVMLIFGASGDLTKRKLMPALYNLAALGLLPKQFAIVGYANAAYTDDTFRDQLAKDMTEFAPARLDPHIWDWFSTRIHYVQGDFADPAEFERLSAKLREVEQDHATQGNRVFYLAVAPQFFSEVVKRLGKRRVNE